MTTERGGVADGERTPLALDLLGANQRLRDTLAMVFHGPAKARCALAQGAQADAVIINLDGVGAEAEWARYRELHPRRPAIVLSLDAAPQAHALAVVLKPVRIEQFLAALDAVDAALRAQAVAPERDAEAAPPTLLLPTRDAAREAHGGAEVVAIDTPTEVLADAPRVAPHADAWRAVCGDAPDGDLDDPRHSATRRCHDGIELLSVLQQALAIAHREQVTMDVCLNDQPIARLELARAEVTRVISLQQWQALCGTALDGAKLVSRRADGAVLAGEQCAIEALLWQTAAWSYRGRLPADTPLDQRIYLRHWPNLTRLLPLPDACRIAALMVRHPMPLARVAEALRIPQRHVFAFHGAASAIGLMGVARREADHLLADEVPAPDSRRALLQGIARRLADDGSQAQSVP
ncbi:MAG: hypothetical protein IPM80_23610 [Proteobacteria bacterium]|nr:hypothetical protein [Pseudomonadota bacterium]